MGRNFHVAIPFFGWVAVAMQRGAETTVDSGDHAFDLPTLAINMFEEPSIHWSAIGVKSVMENFEAYAGMASEAICTAFLANATGERVVRRKVVSMRNSRY
jgi:hypothetical protein